jgi:hypothetical protein
VDDLKKKVSDDVSKTKDDGNDGYGGNIVDDLGIRQENG